MSKTTRIPEGKSRIMITLEDEVIEKIKLEAEKKAAEEAKKARIKAYWEAHKDEKDKLESEKKNLEEKQKKLLFLIMKLRKR